MKHIHYIKSSQEWVCPKSGKWKIICIGGGSSGGMGLSLGSAAPMAVHNRGGATSFGSYLTAAGGEIEPYNAAYTSGNSAGTTFCYPITRCIAAGGEGGFDGFTQKGSTSSIYQNLSNTEIVLSVSGQHSGLGGKYGQAGSGFGAGGGAMMIPIPVGNSISYTSYPCHYKPKTGTDSIGVPAVALGGRAGSVELLTADIDESETVVCSVGAGGGSDLTDVCASAKAFFEGASNLNVSTFTFYHPIPKQPAYQKMLTEGRDGAVILEYLGG